MKKFYTSLVMVAFLFSCSTDEQEIGIEEPIQTDFVTRVNQGEFDNSNLGLYKGIFTTTDASVRATVRIENNGDDIPVAILTTPDGSTFELTSSQKIPYSKNSEDKTNNKVTFSSSEGSFYFSVDENGENIVIENVTFQGSEAEILMAKQTSKQPVETVTGTYYCVDCDPSHPELGDGLDNDLQTFNFMFTGTGEDATIQTQATLNNRTYGPGLAVQYNCEAEGNFTTCTLSGALEDEEGNEEENLSFFGNSGPVYLTGVHTYNNEVAGPECSSVSGTFRYESTRYGTSLLAFQSDEAIDCDIPGFESVIFENFEDSEVGYTLTEGSSSQVLSEDLDLLNENQYYGKLLADTSPANVSYDGGLEDGYFGAQNTDNAENPANTFYLLWENVDISNRTLLEFSLFVATYEENPEGDWDQNAGVGVEYSFNNGDSWQKVIALEAGPGDAGAGRENDLVYPDITFDSVGDITEPQINNTFTQLSRQIEVEEYDSIDIRIYINDLNNNQEDIALDNFLVTGR